MKKKKQKKTATTSLFPIIYHLLFASFVLKPEQGHGELYLAELEKQICELFLWSSLQAALSQAHCHLNRFGDSE